MIRSLFIIIILIFIGVVSVFLFENTGSAQIVWLGYEVTSSVAVLFAVILFLGLVASLLFWLLGRILSLPRMILTGIRRHKKAQGLVELESALIALASENKNATQKAMKAAELLHSDKLSFLGVFLQAEAALQARDLKTAHGLFQKLSSEKDFAFLGYRGLSLTEKEKGNYSQAIDYALTAQKLDKNSLWAVKILANLYEKNKDYQNAIDILTEAESRKLWNKEALAKAIARLYSLLAKQAFNEGNDIVAMENAKAGYKKDNNVQELLPLLAILHAKKQDYNEAEKKLIPLLEKDAPKALKTYEEILTLQFPNASQDAEIKRLSQAEKYLANYNKQINIVHFLADLCLKAQIWGKARSYLETIPSDEYNVLHCTLMAKLEEAENGNHAAAKEWLKRSESL